MQRETQSKGIGGAVSGFLVALIPILMSILSGTELAPDQVTSLREALNVLLVAGGGALVGWVTVYFAPRNKPIEE
jgi:hypothetical protein